MKQRPEAACLHLALLVGLAAVTAVLGVSAARADTIQNQIAEFAALDKVTGRISHLEIPINQTVQFGATVENGKRDLPFEVVRHQGRNAKQNNVALEQADVDR